MELNFEEINKRLTELSGGECGDVPKAKKRSTSQGFACPGTLPEDLREKWSESYQRYKNEVLYARN